MQKKITFFTNHHLFPPGKSHAEGGEGIAVDILQKFQRVEPTVPSGETHSSMARNFLVGLAR